MSEEEGSRREVRKLTGAGWCRASEITLWACALSEWEITEGFRGVHCVFQKGSIEVLTLGACERDLIWKQGLCRDNSLR